MSDPTNPPILGAVSELTGLIDPRPMVPAGTMPTPEALAEYQDLWGITRAVLRLMEGRPETRTIRPSDVVPYLKPSITGDKRSQRLHEAHARQMDRMTAALIGSARRELVIQDDGSFVVRRIDG